MKNFYRARYSILILLMFATLPSLLMAGGRAERSQREQREQREQAEQAGQRLAEASANSNAEGANSVEGESARKEEAMPIGVITNLRAPASRGGSGFSGQVNSIADLEALEQVAWGNGSLGLHRGHAPIQNVLEAFLGIDHDQMHVYMERDGLNLAGTCEVLGLNPEALVESLTYSFLPYIAEAADIISPEEQEAWTERIRTQFRRRVYWKG